MEKNILSSATKKHLKRYHKTKVTLNLAVSNAAIFGMKKCLKKIPTYTKNMSRKHKKINTF